MINELHNSGNLSISEYLTNLRNLVKSENTWNFGTLGSSRYFKN